MELKIIHIISKSIFLFFIAVSIYLPLKCRNRFRFDDRLQIAKKLNLPIYRGDIYIFLILIISVLFVTFFTHF